MYALVPMLQLLHGYQIEGLCKHMDLDKYMYCIVLQQHFSDDFKANAAVPHVLWCKTQLLNMHTASMRSNANYDA